MGFSGSYPDNSTMDRDFITKYNVIPPVALTATMNVPFGENMYHSDELTFEGIMKLAKETGAQKVAYFHQNTPADTSVYNNLQLGVGKYFVIEYLIAMEGVLENPVVVRTFLSPFNPFFGKQKGSSSSQDSEVHKRNVNDSAWVVMFEILLPYNVPHVFVSNKTGESSLSRSGIAGLLPTQIPLGGIAENVTLEGPFSKWFSTITAKGEDLSAFMVLAPNLMESLISSPVDAQVEFGGTSIYLTKLDGAVKRILGPDNIGVSQSNYMELLEYGLANTKMLVRASRPAAEVQPMKTFTSLIADYSLKMVASIARVSFLIFASFVFVGIVGVAILWGVVYGSLGLLPLLGTCLIIGLMGVPLFRIWSHRRSYLKMRRERLAYIGNI